MAEVNVIDDKINILKKQAESKNPDEVFELLTSTLDTMSDILKLIDKKNNLDTKEISEAINDITYSVINLSDGVAIIHDMVTNRNNHS